MTPYEVLGVDPSCTLDEAEDAYHRLLRRYHPDLHQSGGPDAIAAAEARTRALNTAIGWIRVVKGPEPGARSGTSHSHAGNPGGPRNAQQHRDPRAGHQPGGHNGGTGAAGQGRAPGSPPWGTDPNQQPYTEEQYAQARAYFDQQYGRSGEQHQSQQRAYTEEEYYRARQAYAEQQFAQQQYQQQQQEYHQQAGAGTTSAEMGAGWYRPVAVCPFCDLVFGDSLVMKQHVAWEHGLNLVQKPRKTRRSFTARLGRKVRGLRHVPLGYVVPFNAIIALMCAAPLRTVDPLIADWMFVVVMAPTFAIVLARLHDRTR